MSRISGGPAGLVADALLVSLGSDLLGYLMSPSPEADDFDADGCSMASLEPSCREDAAISPAKSAAGSLNGCVNTRDNTARTGCRLDDDTGGSSCLVR